jgi:hypothetical protein
MSSTSRATSLLSTTCAVLLCAASALANPIGLDFGWTISDSPTDPFSNTGTTNATLLYLHVQCATLGVIESAEFDLEFLNGQGEIMQFVPNAPFVNAGGPSNLLLSVPGCPEPPLLVGEIHCAFYGPDELCIVPSATNGFNWTFTCDGMAIENLTVGYSATGGPPSCDEQLGSGILCYEIVSVEQGSWGQIRSLYR